MSLILAAARRTRSFVVVFSIILLLPPLISLSGSAAFSSHSNAIAASQRVLFSTYLGGQDTQSAGIAVDSSGYVYITGITASPAFPLSATTSSPASFPAIFLTKIDPASGSIVYSILIPGTTGASVAGIAVDHEGAAYITGTTFSNEFPTTPGAFQSKFAPNAIQSVFILKLNPAGSALSYSTLLGGTGIQAAASIAVDRSGAAYVTGTTDAPDFPVTVGAFQASHGSAFVSKVSTDGSSLVYSTLFGGSAPDSPTSIAVDDLGSAYITGSAHSTDFPTTTGAFLTAKASAGGADNPFVMKLNPSGSALVYSTYLGGSDGSHNRGNAIAVSLDGSAVVVGSTNSRDFTSVNALFGCPRGGQILKTVDNASTFSRIENGLPPTGLAAIAIDPGKRFAAYAAFAGSSPGLFRTVNSGKTWTFVGGFGPDSTCSLLAVDPIHTSTLYAAVSKLGSAGPSGTVLKSFDGGKTWSDTGVSQQGLVVSALLVDSMNPSTIYVGFGGGSPTRLAGAYKSLDGGATWNPMAGLPPGDVLALEQDPSQSSVVYAGGSKGLFQSRDAGSHWSALIDAPIAAIAIDPTRSSVIYAGVLPNASASSLQGRGNPRKRLGQNGGAAGLIKSVDGGANWRLINKGLRFADLVPNRILVDVNDPSTLYLACNDGFFVSTNAGRRWAPTDLSGYSLRAVAQSLDGTIYAQGSVSDDAFVTKLDPSGGAVVFSTYFGGFGEDQGLGVALDGFGNVYLAGTTRSTNLVVTGKAQQSQLGGGTDVFVTVISSSGKRILYSSYFGGSGEDLLSSSSTGGIALDSARNVYIAGTTQSTDLPTQHALQPALNGTADLENPPKNAFIAKMAAVGKGQ
jgi:photosystem II stability/assembly factor-like uncharacterized protein